MADGGEERAVVMHGAEEDAAYDDPQKTGEPAEEGRLDGAVDGARAGDGRKVMAEEHGSLGGNVVHAVLHGVRGRGSCFIHAPLLREPRAVKDVTREQAGEADEKNDNGTQFNSSSIELALFQISAHEFFQIPARSVDRDGP